MLSYILRRLIITIPTLLGIVTISFLLVRVIPGDPAQAMAGPDATAADVEAIRIQLGLDLPWWQQYVSYLGGVLQGDLGTSARTGAPVLQEILVRLPNTVALAVAALCVASILGCTAGIVAALRRGRLADITLSGLSVLGVSMPVYWTGLLLIMLFAVQLGWLPAAGSGGLLHFVLPVATLAFFAMGFIGRQMRSSMVDAMNADYIRTARARGVSRGDVVVHHGLRNASLPVITVIGLELGGMLGGAVVTETVFAWPGLGRLIVDSIGSRDFAAVQGTVLVFAIILVLVNLVTDLIYAYIDPRIRYD